MFVESDFEKEFKGLEVNLSHIETEFGREGPKDLAALEERINAIFFNIMQLQGVYVTNPLLKDFEDRFSSVSAKAQAISSKIKTLKA